MKAIKLSFGPSVSEGHFHTVIDLTNGDLRHILRNLFEKLESYLF